MRGYIVPSDRRLRGGAGRHCRISLQKEAATEFPPSRGGTSEEGKEQGRRPRACLLFFERMFQYISTPAAVFSQFSAVSPATGRIRQTGLCSNVFFARRRPNPAESLENAIRDGRKNNLGRKCFHIPLRAAARAPNPAPFPVISTGAPAPGRGGAEKPDRRSVDARSSGGWPASVAGRVSPLRLRSGQAASLRSK